MGERIKRFRLKHNHACACELCQVVAEDWENTDAWEFLCAAQVSLWAAAQLAADELPR